MQELQKAAENCPPAFGDVRVDLVNPVPISILGLLFLTMANSHMGASNLMDIPFRSNYSAYNVSIMSFTFSVDGNQTSEQRVR